MSKPLTVSVPHQLGREEATRRLQGGMGTLRTQLGDKFAKIEDSWSGDRMDFKVAVMGQSVRGHLVVLDDTVKVEVQLPMILAMLAEKVKPMIQKQGTLMLEKK